MNKTNMDGLELSCWHWNWIPLVCLRVEQVSLFFCFDDFVFFFFFSFTAQVITYEVEKRRSCHSHQLWTATRVSNCSTGWSGTRRRLSTRNSARHNWANRHRSALPDVRSFVRSARHANDLINIDYLSVDKVPMSNLLNRVDVMFNRKAKDANRFSERRICTRAKEIERRCCERESEREKRREKENAFLFLSLALRVAVLKSNNDGKHLYKC